MALFSVDKKFLLIKLHYFILNAGLAPFVTFGSTIAKQIGYSAVTVGLMFTLLPLMSIFVKITLGTIADKYKLRRFVFVFAVALCFISSFSMAFVNTSSPHKKVFLLCHTETLISSCNDRIENSHFIKMKRPNGSMNCELSCETNATLNQELCTSWKEHSFCAKSTSINELNHNPIKSNFDSGGKSSTVLTKKVKPKPTSHVNFTSTATIQKRHIFNMNNCLYASVSRVRFESSEELIPFCDTRFNVSCSVKCDDPLFMSTIGEDTENNNSTSVWRLFFIYTIFWSMMASACSSSDTVCFDLLGNEPQKYGVQRMFGALGWGVIALSSGWLVDWFSDGSSDKNYAILFYLAAVLLLGDILVIYYLKIEQNVVSVSVFKDVKVLFYNFRTIVYTFWCILNGILMGISWQFLFWHLEDISSKEEFQWIKTIQGLDSLITTVVGELPFFLISGWIIKKFGYVNTMSVVLFASAMRMFSYSMLPSPVWVLPVEFLTGFSFSMCYVLIASYSSSITIPGTEGTVQALFGAMFDGLGVSLGSLIGGLIYHNHDGAVLFAVFGYISAIAFMLHVCIHSRLKTAPVYKTQNVNGVSAHYTTPNDGINILERS